MAEWDESADLAEQTWSYFMRSMKALWKLLGTEQRSLRRVVLWGIGIRALALLTPLFMKMIFDEMHTRSPEQLLNQTVWWLISGLVVGQVISLVLHHFYKERRFLASMIKLENWWPVQAQAKLLELSMSYHERENTGKKIAKINKGVDRLVEVMTQLFWDFFPQLFYLFINIVVICIMDWRIGLIFCLPFIPAGWLNLQLYRRYYHDWDTWEKQKELSQGYFCQSLINVSTVQHFGQEERENSRLAQVRGDMARLDWGIARGIQWWFFAIGLILHLSFIGTVVAGLWFVSQGLSTVGTIVYVLATGSVSIEALWGLIHTYARIMRSLVSVERMQQLLDEPVEVTNAPDAITPAAVTGRVQFTNACFRYPGKDADVLHDFSLSVPPGSMTALVARSGEGKTTVIRLLCRMYDITGGTITLDGLDIRRIDLPWYRRLFAVVQQDVDIFDGSLEENISYPWPQASDHDIHQAVVAAHLQTVISDHQRFPAGLATQVGERGVRLSGGERQRVGIARAYLALLHGARFLILDEATSSLDSEAERAIQAMVDQLRQQQQLSIIAIAHRLSTIRRADTICVLGEGGILEQGNHADLLRQNGLYARLVDLQQLGELEEDEPTGTDS